MQRYYNVARDASGRAVSGAQVAVYQTGTSTLATIYAASDSALNPSSSIANPMTTDANGGFGFAAANASYDIVVSGNGFPTYTLNKINLFDAGTTATSSTAAAGSSTQVQYNVGGVLGATSTFTFAANQLTVGGSGTPGTFSNMKYFSYDSVNGFVQDNIQNKSAGASASADVVASNDTATDTTNFMSMGVNSSGWADATWTINGANDGYAYGPNNVAFGTSGAGKSLVFFVGGTLAANAVSTVTSTTWTIPAAVLLIATGGIRYNQGGTGAVNTTVSAKLQEIVSVKDFGAVGDGSTNDTTAFNNAIAAGILVKAAVYVPAGTYLLNALTAITDSVMIYGTGRGSILKFNTTGTGITISGIYTSQSKSVVLRDLAFTNVTNTPAAFVANNSVNFTLDHCYFSNTSATYCFDNQIGYGTTINKCVFSDVTGTAIRLRDNGAASLYSYATTIQDTDITRMSVDGISVEGAQALNILRCVIEGNTGVGIKTNSNGGSSSIQSWNINIVGSYFDTNTGNAINLQTDGNLYWGAATLMGCTFNGTQTIALGSKSKIAIIGCYETGGGGVTTVSGSANAEATLINSINFTQSGTFTWINLGTNTDNASSTLAQSFSNSTNSTSTSTGAVKIPNGGLGVGLNGYFGGSLTSASYFALDGTAGNPGGSTRWIGAGGSSNNMFINAGTGGAVYLYVNGSAQGNVNGTAWNIGTRINLASVASSAAAGDLWQDSTQKAVGTFQDGIKQMLSGVIFTSTATATVANTLSETSIVGTGVGTKTLPANFFLAGKTVRIRVKGTLGDTGTPTLQIKAKYGSTVVLDSTAVTLATFSGTPQFAIDLDITCRSTGAAGTVQCGGTWDIQPTGVGTNTRYWLPQNLATIDTTASSALDVTATWGTASASNTISGTITSIEVLN